MAVVGDAYIVVRAIGDSVKKDIQRDFNGMDKIGQKAGRDAAKGFRDGANRGGGFRFFGETFFANSDRAVKTFRRLSVAQNFLFTAIPGVLGAIGALGSGLLVLVGVLGNAARGAIVLGNVFGGLAQGAITLKLAFSGVGDAISAGLDAQEQSISNTRAQEAATRRLRDARLNLKRLIEEEKPEALAEARERAVRAEERSADASLANERAIRTYNAAQEETLDALEDLNDARDEARERIQQLRFEVEGGAISEKKARLEFEKARDSLQRVQDLPPNSRARQEAELAFAEAELNLRKAIDNNNDLKKAEEESTRAGVEGSQEVVRAKERIANAQQAEADAGIAAARAARDASRAQEEAAEAAADAAAGGSVERDINRRIANAREQVTLAEQALGDAASSGINAYAEALAKLSPEQVDFVDFMVNSFIPALDSLKEAAGRELLPALERALTIIQSRFGELEPLIQETGGVLGGLAEDFAKTFFEGENFERLKRVWQDNNGLLDDLGTTVINLAEGVLILLDNARPLVTAFGDWAVNTSEAWKNTQILKDENGELAEEFDRLKGRIETITGIFGNYKTAFGDIFDVINQPGGAGDQLLTYFEEASERFKNFIAGGKEDGSLNEFFTNSTTNFTKILDLLANIGGGLLNLGASPGVGQFLDSLNGVTDTFNDLGLRLAEEDGPIAKLGEFLEEFAKLLDLLTESGALEAFFDTLTNVTGFINDVLGSETAQAILRAFAPLAGVLLAFSQIAVAAAFVSTVFRTIFGGFASAILGFARGALKFFSGQAFKLLGKPGLLGLFGRIFGFLGRIFSFIIRFAGPIGFIVSILLAVVPIIIKNWDKIVKFFGDLFNNLKEGFGEAIEKVKEVFGEGLEKIKEGFKALWENISTIFSESWERLSAYFNDVVFPFIKSLPGKFADFVKGLFDWFGEKLSAAWDFIVNFFKTVVKFYFNDLPKLIAGFAGDVFGFLGDLIGNAWDNVSNFFENTIFPFFKNLPRTLADTAGNIWDFLKDTFKNAINFVIDKWNAFKLDLRLPNSIFGIPLPPGIAGAGVTIETPNIPRLATGGIVQATRGGIAALIGEGGQNERIEPLDPSGLSRRDRAIIDRLANNRGVGTTINVYPSAGMNERDLAELVSKRLAFQLRRGAA